MGHGGKRTGAGRKPGPKKARVIGMDGRLKPEAFSAPVAPLAETVHDPDGLLAPPADLTPDEGEAWKLLAPYALKERTLTASRTPGFRKLCQEWVYCASLDKRVRELGIASHEADRLLKRLNDWKKLLKGSLADFSLKSFGKPVAVDKPKPVANPWGALGGAAAR